MKTQTILHQFPQTILDPKVQYRQMPNDQTHLNLYNEALKLCESNLFEQAQKMGDKFFKRGYIEQSISIYQKIISTDLEHEYQIAGLGNKQMSQSYYVWNAFKWYDQKRNEGKFKGSPYDALSLCYLIIKDIPSCSNLVKKGNLWYQKMIQKSHKNIGLLMGYGNLRSGCQDYDQAISLYEKITQIRPNFVNALVAKQMIHQYKRIDKIKSTQLAKEILQISPNNEYALFILAKNEGDIDQKIQKLKKADQICPEYTRIKNQLGICYGGIKKDYDQAINWYKKCVQQSPYYYSSYNNIGVNNQLKQQYDQAKKWYYKALQINPQYNAPHNNLIDIYDAIDFTEQQIIQQANLHANINKYYFYLKIGTAYYNRNPSNTQKAIFWQQKAIQVNPGAHQGYSSLGITYDEDGKYEKAIQNYLKCVQINPQFSSAYFNAGIAFKNLGKQDKAIEMYKKSIEVNPKYSFAYNNLGNIYKSKGQYQQAAFYYIQAIQNNSTYTLALNNLGYCYLKLEKYKDAYKYFQRAKTALPNDNNNLSSGNKAFLKQQLNYFDAEGQQWIKTGEIHDEDKQIFRNFISHYQNRFGQANASPQKIQVSEDQVFNKSVLKIIQLINEDKFQLNNFDEIFCIIEIIYDENPEYFHIIPLLVIQNFLKRVIQEKKPVMDAQFQWRKTFKELYNKIKQKNTQQNLEIVKDFKLEQNKFFNQKINLFKEKPFFKTYEQLLSEVQNINQKAQQSFTNFSLLVEQVRKNSKGIPAGITTKIPIAPSQQLNILIKIVENILKPDLDNLKIINLIERIQENIRSFQEKNLENVIEKIIQLWSQEATKILASRYENKIKTVYDIKDLIKGKVLFNNLEDVQKAFNVSVKYSNQQGFNILGLTNQINTSQQIALTFLIKQIPCELKLCLKQPNGSQYQNSLSDEINKILLSPLGCIFGSYLYMQKGVKYSLSENCYDIAEKLQKTTSQQQKSIKQSAQNVLSILKGEKKSN